MAKNPEGPRYWPYGVVFDPKLASGERPHEYHHPQIYAKRGIRPSRRKVTATTVLSRMASQTTAPA